jgi:beta-carotene/zeaxanthin 4-ketolase
VQVLLSLLIPLLLLTSWLISLMWSGGLDLGSSSLVTISIAIALRTFLHTGLFVTAHDAMHGTVSIAHPRLNHLLGSFCTLLYALLPYAALQSKHHLHHRHPGTDLDPDFCDRGIGQWYVQFMRGYLVGSPALAPNYQQLGKFVGGMAAIFISLHWLAHVPVWNLLLFWVLPILLSSMQLFYFGTFLPHRLSADLGKHRSRSSNLSPLWSFLTCYHFGYHWEHHEYPHLPWYELPSVQKK